MRHTAIFAATLAALLALAAPARAGMEEDCVQEYDRDLQISGCTAVIGSGQYSGRNLAIAYNNRGIAYDDLGEYRRAIEDYDRALRLDPDDALAYNNRGIALDNLSRSGEGSNGKAIGGEAAEITSTGTGSFVDVTGKDAYLSGVYKVAVIIGVVVLGLFLLLLAFGAVLHSLTVAFILFGWAAESGFIGVALYIILWVVAMPLMLTICIVGGVIRLLSETEF